ncbi:hypothetical protein Poli38472_013589 [Pythium oligandrum]|uniref:E2 ubiquitin-conjugating enzyme n=1 Tax=Pythium oligandrum TaxID=41045 RepID=A0A8K1FG05_PYTOL|nr:hypothetical protein Poli38472_013589 [Pythium oligandrum]|eukprot:TMW61126.1 hypothetical protein Poli38472_013589 [Pythium oligandrum]
MGIMRRPSMDAIEAEDVAARVYVGNLKPKVNETHLTEIFVRFGKLLHVWVARKPPGFAFVQFLNQSDAECAVESFQGEDGLEILGKRVKVQMAGDKAQSKMAKERPYPFEPPKMRFETKIWHPNISSQTGAICLDILKDQWSPALTIKTALLSIQALLSAAEPTDPQDAEVARVYMDDPEQFQNTARFSVARALYDSGFCLWSSF